MNPIGNKGQTALEYLLIVVVAIIVVVAVMVWMQSTTTGAIESANESTSGVLCSVQKCTVNADCDGVDDCPSGATCNTVLKRCQTP